jgi:hypothetical protein
MQGKSAFLSSLSFIGQKEVNQDCRRCSCHQYSNQHGFEAIIKSNPRTDSYRSDAADDEMNIAGIG